MRRSRIACGMIALLGVLLFAGCQTKENQLLSIQEKGEACEVDVGEEIKICYSGEWYTVLSESVSQEDVGSLVGYVRKLFDVGNGRTISILNIYTTAEEGVLLADIDGVFRKAVRTPEEVDGILQVADLRGGTEEEETFVVNLENATQILGSHGIYQITEETVSGDLLGNYLACIGTQVTFDMQTGKAIPKETLKKIDWTGDGEAKQKRADWTYTNVYEIQGEDTASKIAVEINSEYRMAELQQQ